MQSFKIDMVNLIEPDAFVQKSGDSDLIGRVQHGAGARRRTQRVPRELQAGKAVPMRLGIK